MTKFYFASDCSGIILIDADTQAEAEAKLLAAPDLIGVRNIDDFDISFRAKVSEPYVRPPRDNIIPWSTIIQVVLAYRGRA